MGTPVDTIPYTSGGATWGDLLTAYNGVARTYDGAGNLTNDGTWSYYWQNGWELVFMTDGPTAWSFMYDANGMRTNRGFGEIIYQYVYNGSQLSQMTADGNTLSFAYDAGGVPMTVNYNGTNYYYIVNLQGDVIAILDENGNCVVEYSYDPWGNILSATGTMADTLGESNPLTYRGYVYDQETELFYLQSRYYDPESGRFINADNYVSTGQGILGNNMFAYCRNNPVRRLDVWGTTSVDIFDSDGNPLTDDDERFDGGRTSVGSQGKTSGSSGLIASGGNNGSGRGPTTSSSAGNGTTTVYRAMSPAEYNNTMSSQKFSAGSNSYESGKYYATTHENASQWGNRMYPNGDFRVMEVEFDYKILNSPQSYYWEMLDGIGPAYYFSNAAANLYMITIR